MSDPNSPVRIRPSQIDDQIVVIEMDVPNSSANVLDDALFAALDSAISEVSGRDLRGAILISAKPSIFVAGADLKHIRDTWDWSDERIVQFCDHGRGVMKKFNTCPFPTVAAIHGAAVGGGLEIAMWCDYRIATNHKRTILGLPEVKLGLVPGWAGTSRLPRLTSFEFGAQCVATGQSVGAARAAEVSLVDRVIECGGDSVTESLEKAAVELIHESADSDWQEKRTRLEGPAPGHENISEIVSPLARRVVQSGEIFPYAPTVALEHLARTAPLSAAEAEASESMAFAQVYGSPASRGLLHHYFLERDNRKQPGLVDMSIECQPVSSVAIIGAGVMGKSIAARCVQAGIDVRLLDADPAKTAAAVADVEAKSAKGSVSAIPGYDGLAGVDLVIESVVETAGVKTNVLEKAAGIEGAPAWFSTNTSAIPVESLAPWSKDKTQFCGIHFCHPELMSLVEVICGPDTDEATIARGVSFVRQLRMMPVAINDCPGFVVNRLLAAMLNESLELYAQGYAIESIDEAVREFGFLGGPFQIIDIIGADTCMYAGRSMWENGLRCVSMSPILPRMVKTNRLGRKIGNGFYSYDGDEPRFDPDVDDQLKAYRKSESRECDIEALESIAVQIMAQMAVEATRILEEEIVNEPGDIDLCMINGLSFPARRGGLLFWADHVGVAQLNQVVVPGKDNPVPRQWAKMVDANTTFYE